MFFFSFVRRPQQITKQDNRQPLFCSTIGVAKSRRCPADQPPQCGCSIRIRGNHLRCSPIGRRKKASGYAIRPAHASHTIRDRAKPTRTRNHERCCERKTSAAPPMVHLAAVSTSAELPGTPIGRLTRSATTLLWKRGSRAVRDHGTGSRDWGGPAARPTPRRCVTRRRHRRLLLQVWSTGLTSPAGRCRSHTARTR